MSSDNVVHVIDDDEAIRQSLSFLLRSAGIAARAYESGDVFLDALPSVPGGCVVTDVRMPGMSGLELLLRIRHLKLDLPVIVITGHGDVPLAVEAMKHGAADFIEKPFDDEVLLSAVRAALSKVVADHERHEMRNAIGEKLAALSNRERQVLEGLIAGNANKVIAYDLGISPRTVEIYRANVMTKMGAKSLSELVRMALIGGVLGSGTAPAPKS